MNLHRRTLVLLAAVLGVLFATGFQQEGAYTGTIVTEGTHSYEDGQVLPGDLLVLGGHTRFEPGSRLAGSAYMLGGTLEIDGTVDGSVSYVSGALRLGPGAVIHGDLGVGGVNLQRSPEATIGGRVDTGVGLAIPELPAAQPPTPGERAVQWVVGALGAAVFALIVALVVPHPIARVGTAAVGYPVVSGALGILVGIVAMSLLVLMAFTLVLIPVAMLGALLLLATGAYGWVAIGLQVGRGLGRLVQRNPRPAAAAFVGTLVFTLAMNAVELVPFLGAVVPLLALTVGLGAVFLTGFGRRTFVPASASFVDATSGHDA